VHDQGVLTSATEPRYLDLAALRRLIGEKEDITSEDLAQLHGVLDDLVSKGVLHRGLILKCPRCANADWYRPEETAQFFVCHRCRGRHRITHETFTTLPIDDEQSGEPSFYYRLQEMVYQAWNNGSWVGILGLDALIPEGQEPIFVPEVEVLRARGADRVQVDFICSADGRVILGEAKKPGKAEAEQMGKYEALATELHADLAFVTSCETWSDGTKEKLRHLEQRLERQDLRLHKRTAADLGLTDAT